MIYLVDVSVGGANLQPIVMENNILISGTGNVICTQEINSTTKEAMMANIIPLHLSTSHTKYIIG